MIIKNPLKDHRIVHNEHDIKIVKGEEIDIPDVFKQTLISEGIIKTPQQKEKDVSKRS